MDAAELGRKAALAPGFRARMAALVACRTDATAPGAEAALAGYLHLVCGWLDQLGFEVERPEAHGRPFAIARRVEDPALPTILTYSHGDVVPGMAGRWAHGRDPWKLTETDGMWFGRGIADNKGQFLVNLTAVEALLAARGTLGLNLIWLIEMGEEIGSPGLADLCAREAGALAADILLASDGPRLAIDRPTLFLGARGGITFRLDLELRDGGRHSGNFGGALRNPAVLMAHALASIVDARGALQIADWAPPGVPEASRAALAGLVPAGGEVDPDWGVPGLTPAERIHAWSAAEVLAIHAGDPPKPVNAIPPSASAWVQLRFAPGTCSDGLEAALRRHLDAQGFADIAITPDGPAFEASQTPVDHPAALRVAGAMARATGAVPVVLPALGGSLPNDIFREGLGLPTLWVPHSYPGCSQHAPDEHLPEALLVEAAGLMAAILEDLSRARPEDLR